MADGKNLGLAAGAVRPDRRQALTPAQDKKAAFLAAVAEAIEKESFIRLTLGKFRGEGEPSKAVATLVLLKGRPHVKLVTSFARKDETKNFAPAEGVARLGALLGETYQSATLFSTERDMTLSYSRKREARLASGKTTMKSAHDRAKTHLVAPERPYLKILEVTDAEGRVKPTMQGKYRQICRFIEIADALLKESGITREATLSIVDIGSGKGYLTFALYDHLTTTLGRDCRMTGIELRSDLVDFCNGVARQLGFSGLSFVAAQANQAERSSVDIVIALHACDTATDDAMAFGVAADAKLILSAPCCQHELAPQLEDAADGLRGLIKYPLLKQRQADLVTDAARALLLEASGYKVKVIEFVSTEHTSKNILIAAIKSDAVNRDVARQQYRALKAATGFSTHHLASRLKGLE
jgi:hypothetical protein